MVEEKVINVAQISKVASKLEAKASEFTETAVVLRQLAASQNVLAQLGSTRDAIKEEINKVNKILAQKQEEIKAIKSNIAEYERVEKDEIVRIKDNVANEKKKALEQIKETTAEQTNRIKTIEAETKIKIAEYGNLIKESKETAATAVAMREKAEAELNKLKKTLVGA